MTWRCAGCGSCHPDCGCVHEICPGCYCSKRRDQVVCDACHAYNHDHQPYLDRYGPDNIRAATPAGGTE